MAMIFFGQTDASPGEHSLPFQLQAIGINHVQEDIHRVNGYPYHHWIQVKQGRCRLETLTGIELIEPGDGFYLKPNEFHAYASADCQALVVDFVTFDGSAVENALASGPLSRSGAYRLDSAQNVLRFIEQAWVLAADNHPSTSRRMSVCIYGLLMELSLAASTPRGESLEDASRRLLPVLDFAHNNLEGNIHVENLATLLEVSPQHLGRIFRARLGVSPSEYVIRLRMTKARELLLNHPELRVNEVSQSVGIQDVNYFCRIFRRREGCSPGKFRTLHGF